MDPSATTSAAEGGTRYEGFDPAVFGDRLEPEGFVAALGLVYDLVSPTRVEAHLDAGPGHFQPYGLVHGGVHATIIETLSSVGAAVNVVDRGKAVVGVSNQTDFLRAQGQGRLRAVAEPLHAGRTQQLWQCVITGEDGKVVARGQVRLQVLDAARVGQ